MWETTPETVVEKGMAMMRVSNRDAEKQMRDVQKSSVLGKLWMQMTGKLKHGAVNELLQLKEFRQLLRMRRLLIMRNGVIYWMGSQTDHSKWILVLPVVQRKEVLRAAHEAWGHEGDAQTTFFCLYGLDCSRTLRNMWQSARCVPWEKRKVSGQELSWAVWKLADHGKCSL